LNSSDRREVKRDITLSGIGGFFDGSEWFSKKLPSEFNFGVTWKKSSSIVDQLMVVSGKHQVGLSQPMLELSMAADMPKWSVQWAKAAPVLKGISTVINFISPGLELTELLNKGFNEARVTSSDIGHLTMNVNVSLGAWRLGGWAGAGVGLAWSGMDTYAKSQHYTPLFGEYAGQEINGWNAMRIRGNEYQEVSIRQNIQQFHETRAQATIRFETQQTLDFIRRMEDIRD
jgi:hypothetical protein